MQDKFVKCTKLEFMELPKWLHHSDEVVSTYLFHRRLHYIDFGDLLKLSLNWFCISSYRGLSMSKGLVQNCMYTVYN